MEHIRVKSSTMTAPKPPYLGAAYYPEAWPVAQIDEDIRLMKEAGMNVMRIAEFAWSTMEPSEGKYDFTWLHHVVGKLADAGIGVILCTPTCTPPIWLTEKHPEVLCVTPDGKRLGHGSRRHACPTNMTYRRYSEMIALRLAREFGKDKRIIGWQIDNEVASPFGRSCACPSCLKSFRAAMKRKFRTIATLNDAWCLALWSQHYQSFAQLPPPRTDIWHHPSLLAAWQEFSSNAYVDFVKAQADVLHEHVKQPVGTDMMPYTGVDYEPMHRALDVVQFNHYNDMKDLWQVAFWFDLCRTTIPGRPFWNTETSTCWNGTTASGQYREPGFCRVNSWLPIALGGEANLYWLWRQHRAGHENMHGAVLDSSGRPLHTWNEVQELGRDFRKASSFLNDSHPTQSGLAMHFSFLSSWTMEQQPIHFGFQRSHILEAVYRPMLNSQLRPDVIQPAADIANYKVIVSPCLMVLDEAVLQARLLAWIKAGGTWIAGPMTDIRDVHGSKFTHAPFGVLEDWAGIRCKYSITADPPALSFRWQNGRMSRGTIWQDGFELQGAKALATYTEKEMKGLAAVTQHKVGKGRIIVIGTLLAPDDFQKLLLTVTAEAGIRPASTRASDTLLIAPREGQTVSGAVVIELGNKQASLTIKHPAVDLLTGRTIKGRVTVPPYGVMVLQDTDTLA